MSGLPLNQTLDDIKMEIEHRLERLEKYAAILRAGRNSRPGMKLFALGKSRPFGEGVAASLNMELSSCIEKYHPDGEIYIRPGVNVRCSVVFVISNLYGCDNESVNDEVAKLTYFVGALKDAAAAEVTVVAPYLPYARSDRKVKSREPVITKYLARVLEAVGVDRLITMDVHSLQAYQNAYSDCRTDNLECKIEFANFFARRLSDLSPSSISVLAPDAGGFARCEFFRQALHNRIGKGVGIAWLDKKHDEDNSEIKHADTIIGDIRPVMIILDDMIASGGTISLAANTAKNAGAGEIWVAATHGLFVGNANTTLLNSNINHIVISDTILPFRLHKEILEKTEIVPTTQLFAEAIRRTYTGESLSSMFQV